jgi:hypothetical protein
MVLGFRDIDPCGLEDLGDFSTWKEESGTSAAGAGMYPVFLDRTSGRFAD